LIAPEHVVEDLLLVDFDLEIFKPLALHKLVVVYFQTASSE
jgi:hypothetical protein